MGGGRRDCLGTCPLDFFFLKFQILPKLATQAHGMHCIFSSPEVSFSYGGAVAQGGMPPQIFFYLPNEKWYFLILHMLIIHFLVISFWHGRGGGQIEQQIQSICDSIVWFGSKTNRNLLKYRHSIVCHAAFCWLIKYIHVQVCSACFEMEVLLKSSFFSKMWSK